MEYIHTAHAYGQCNVDTELFRNCQCIFAEVTRLATMFQISVDSYNENMALLYTTATGNRANYVLSLAREDLT